MPGRRFGNAKPAMVLGDKDIQREETVGETGTRTAQWLIALLAITIVAGSATEHTQGSETWRGLSVAPEHRCAPYERDQYPYSQAVEAHIIAGMGGPCVRPVRGPALRQPPQGHRH